MNTSQQICLDIAMSIDYCCVKGFPAWMLHKLDRLAFPYACSTLRYHLSVVQLSRLPRLMPSAATACEQKCWSKVVVSNKVSIDG